MLSIEELFQPVKDNRIKLMFTIIYIAVHCAHGRKDRRQ